MNINQIKLAEKHPKTFCTCAKAAESFPWGLPEFSCNLTDSMEACSKLKITNNVFKAPCKFDHVRTERDTENIRRQRRDVIDFGDDNAPIMFPMDVTAGRSIPVSLWFIFIIKVCFIIICVGSWSSG